MRSLTYSVPNGLGTSCIQFMVAILAPRVQVPDLKGLGPSDRKTRGLVSTLHYVMNNKSGFACSTSLVYCNQLILSKKYDFVLER